MYSCNVTDLLYILNSTGGSLVFLASRATCRRAANSKGTLNSTSSTRSSSSRADSRVRCGAPRGPYQAPAVVNPR